MPALKVNIIIVHLRGVVFPRALAPRENNISRVNNYDFLVFSISLVISFY
jgi:hypothetical protein